VRFFPQLGRMSFLIQWKIPDTHELSGTGKKVAATAV
jgi:hypothetical protein